MEKKQNITAAAATASLVATAERKTTADIPSENTNGSAELIKPKLEPGITKPKEAETSDPQTSSESLEIIEILSSDEESEDTPTEEVTKAAGNSSACSDSYKKPSEPTKRPTKDGRIKEGRPQADYSWMEGVFEKIDEEAVKKPTQGKKAYLMLNILAQSIAVGDKVVIFTQCLGTLNYIEEILETPSWGGYCIGHEKNPSLGGWRKGFDFLRIDGAVSAQERGQRVRSFHNESESVRAFLISIEAGGMG